MRRTRDAIVRLLMAGFTISLLAACTSSRQYTSLDLALLPCGGWIAIFRAGWSRCWNRTRTKR